MKLFLIALLCSVPTFAENPPSPQTTAEAREAIKDLTLREQQATIRFLTTYQQWQIQLQQMIDSNADKQESERLQREIETRKTVLAKTCGENALDINLKCVPRPKEVTSAQPVPAARGN